MLISVNNTIINHTCQDRSPYVYEIRHKPSGKLYIGVRFAKNCHHTELLEYNGYKTSSKTVKELICQDGLGSFEITYIEEFDNIKDAQEKEFYIQKCVEAHRNELYINKSIGCRVIQDDEVLRKRKNTNLKKYGYATQLNNILEKTRKTNIKKYGVNWVVQSEVVKNKIKQTNLEKYGATHYNKTEEAKKKMRNGKTCKPVGQYKDGNLIRLPSLASVKEYGYEKTCIRDCCNGKQKHHKGFEWKFI